MHFHRCFSLVN